MIVDVHIGVPRPEMVDKAIRVRAGRFKVPFSLEETTGVKHLDFVDRSLAATQLAPGRDVGVMAHGRVVFEGTPAALAANEALRREQLEV
jgi:hypothetical protein